MAGIKISDIPAAPSALLTDVFPVDQLPGPVTYKESNQQLLTLFQSNGAALSKTDDTNVTMTLGGSPTIALLNAASMTLGWTGQLSVPRGGTANSTFTAYSVICAGTTATGAFQNVSGLGSSGQVLTSNGAGALPTWQASTITGAALTRTNDTNVTLTLGGSPTTALVNAASITVGWTGTLAETRGGTAQSTYTLGDTLYSSAANTLSKLSGNITTAKQYLSQTGSGAVSAAPAWATISGGDVTGAALTRVNDTNVTLTLGGTPSTALLQAASITAGWAGLLSLARGGTNKNITADNGAMVYCDADSFELLASTATAGQIVRSGASSAPSWSTATFASTYTASNLLYSNGANTVTGLATANNGVLVTSSGGVPSISSTLPSGLTIPGYAASGANSDITSLTGLTGTLRAPTGITSSAALNLVTFGYTASAVNYFSMTNSSTGSPLQLLGTGSDATVTFGMYAKGGVFHIADSLATTAARLRYYAGNNLNYTSLGVATAAATSLDLTLPSADGANNALMKTNGSGVLSFTSTPVVTNITFGAGTALANYVEGTYTPIVTLVGGAGNTVPVYSSNIGSYTRIGNICYCTISLSGDGGAEGAGTGFITISLPIAASSNIGNVGGIAIQGNYFNNATRVMAATSITAGATTTNVFPWTSLTTGYASGIVGNDQNNTTRGIYLQFWYYV